MELQERINAFSKLGDLIAHDSKQFLGDTLKLSEINNPWFSKQNVLISLDSIAKMLNKKSLQDWLSNYSVTNCNLKVLLITAGNIPCVGFHDLLCVLITGNKVIIKFSSKDNILLPFLIKNLIKIEPSFANQITISNTIIKEGFDAVIATGSDSSAKYFNYYFNKSKCIIRKNRRSIAILDGNESKQELEGLAEDVFLYYGLGCRNVSKIFVPFDYDFDKLFQVFYKYKDVLLNSKYCNNYDYNKAVFLMNSDSLLENGFIILKEDNSIQSPIAMLFYQFYNDIAEVNKYILENEQLFQCVVAKNKMQFGQTQFPQLHDYADNVDTIKFLNKL